MGNPNGDLFIKTISWLFVIPASHKRANNHPNIITFSFGSSGPELHFNYTVVCQLTNSTISTNSGLSLSQRSSVSYSCLPHFPSFPLSQAPHFFPLPTPSIMSSSTCSNSQPKYLVVLVGNCHGQTPSRCEPAQACV